MARTATQIQKELAAGDLKQRQVINEQLARLPQAFAGQREGLKAQQTKAFGDILGGAKQRGLKFSGIPLDEQAQYTSTVFLPALAGLREQENTQRASLQGAIGDILAQRAAMAQQIRQQELDREEARRQAAASRAAARAAQPNFGDIIKSVLGGGGAQGGANIKDGTNVEKAKLSANSYAKRINETIKDPIIRQRIFMNLRKRAIERNDLGAMTKYNALAQYMNSAQRFNLDNGTIFTDSALGGRSPGTTTSRTGNVITQMANF